jgi:RNA polymerase sigma-70 factor (ECF subfamily)
VEEYHDLADEKQERGRDVDKERVWMAIGELEEKFRSVIVLRLIDGYSTEETARILNIPLGTVLSRLSRGQKKLRELLEPHIGAKS